MVRIAESQLLGDLMGAREKKSSPEGSPAARKLRLQSRINIAVRNLNALELLKVATLAESLAAIRAGRK